MKSHLMKNHIDCFSFIKFSSKRNDFAVFEFCVEKNAFWISLFFCSSWYPLPNRQIFPDDCCSLNRLITSCEKKKKNINFTLFLGALFVLAMHWIRMWLNLFVTASLLFLCEDAHRVDVAHGLNCSQNVCLRLQQQVAKLCQLMNDNNNSGGGGGSKKIKMYNISSRTHFHCWQQIHGEIER